MKLIKKAITYINMAILDEILMDLKGLTIAFEVWEKLKVTYEIMMLVNQVHPMHKLVCMQLDESKSVVEHLSSFTRTLSQLQDFGLPSFDEKLTTLLMTFPHSWETLIVSLSNNPNLTLIVSRVLF